ncbi:MAG: hypothetical protein Faunusvirus20_16 [Faunusvirus sp.]|jgi:hypothetical protein|uniref:Uncharacterized protein n=1 Tax=Faunusvirus sp. TaxID=2487766 RepID=A0A3G5A0Z3_9VIRU|nr:MAG: hypothetical protein Faunusvirus20_16 [Faunusvirus sp.]
MSNKQDNKYYNNSMIAQEHVFEFIDLVKTGDEVRCIDYIDKYTDFYNTEVYTSTFVYVSKSVPLMIASRAGLDKVVAKLLAKNVDVNYREQYGWNTLLYACRDGFKSIVCMLLDGGINVHSKSDYGYTALHIAMIYSKYDIAVEIVKRDGDTVNINAYNHAHELKDLVNKMKNIYQTEIFNIIEDKSSDNIMAMSFRKTYVPQIVNMICEYML